MSVKHIAVTLGLCGLFSALVPPVVAGSEDDVTATVLMWQEQEPGVAPYPTRMLVTAGHLRIDEGRAEDDYLLFDRASGRLYSVMHETGSVLVIDAAPLPSDAGPAPALDIEVREATDAPRVAGRTVQYFRARDAGELCSQATLAPGLLPEVTTALREMRAILAGRQYRDLDKTPEEFRTPCFLAAYIYAVDTPLAIGLPIQESIEGGAKRVLLDYMQDKPMPIDLFSVPADYVRQQVP